MDDADESIWVTHTLVVAGAATVAAIAVFVAFVVLPHVGFITTIGWGGVVTYWSLTQSPPAPVRAVAVGSVALAAIGTLLAASAS